MFALKPISPESVASAIAKAEHYRLLNEPSAAESICQDILAIDSTNQQALICLILALSDQLQQDLKVFNNAQAAAAKLESPYDRCYYTGIVWERRAKARYLAGGSDSRHSVYEWVLKALDCFGAAEKVRPPGNDDALLRWNACVRFLSRNPELEARPEEKPEPIVSE